MEKVTGAMVMSLLRARVPLSLLCDLVEPYGPASAEIMDVEAGRIDPHDFSDREPALV